MRSSQQFAEKLNYHLSLPFSYIVDLAQNLMQTISQNQTNFFIKISELLNQKVLDDQAE